MFPKTRTVLPTKGRCARLLCGLQRLDGLTFAINSGLCLRPCRPSTSPQAA